MTWLVVDSMFVTWLFTGGSDGVSDEAFTWLVLSSRSLSSEFRIIECGTSYPGNGKVDALRGAGN